MLKRCLLSLNLLGIILVNMWLTVGCLPVIFVAGATLGGAVVYDKRSTNTIVQDQQIGRIATYQLNHDTRFKGDNRIKVVVFNRSVLLVGEVTRPAYLAEATRVAMQVKGVKRVYNELRVTEKISIKAQTNDTWITSKVKSEMLATKGLHSTQIKVVTENGTVYLMGIVTHYQGDLASNVARRVQGVEKVVKVFDYES